MPAKVTSAPASGKLERRSNDAGDGPSPKAVVMSVANLGSATAQPTWSDAVYFSTNAVLDGPDTQLRSQSRSQALAVGSSYQVTNTVAIPGHAPPSYYLIVKADDQNTTH
jgi:hypothetical protein